MRICFKVLPSRWKMAMERGAVRNRFLTLIFGLLVAGLGHAYRGRFLKGALFF